MSNLTPILTLRRSTETAITWMIQQLRTYGFQVERTFDLQTARIAHASCPCPNHGTADCTCQMVVLVAHVETGSVIIVVHGQDDHTCFSLVDGASQKLAKRIIQVLHPIPESLDIQFPKLTT